MKNGVLFLACLLLIGCQSTEEPEPPSLNDTIESNVSDKSAEEVVPLEENAQVDQVYLEDFPDDWLNLTQHADQGVTTEVIYYYCEAEVPTIHFTPKKGEAWEVYAGFGQDGIIRDVLGFEATRHEIAANEVIKGSFLAVLSDTMEINFEWEVDAMRCKFDGFGYSYPYFVSSNNKSAYTRVEEDCEGLWE